MAFFKEKIVGNLGTVTAVDWGRSIGEGLNYDALNKYYQRKFDQKIKDLELTPQVFDTTLSFLEPKIQSKVLELQNEYKSNADVSYRKADFSDVAINARQRNAEILKELTKMEAGIQSLEEAETEFANNPDAFFPHETNSKLSARETKLRAAYTELINGDYKTGQADEVLNVYFKDGKTMVTIDGIGDVELNDLRPYDQPREGLYSEFTNQFSEIATTATTNSAEASALLTKLLGSIDNDLNYTDIQDLLDFQITIPSEFTTKTGMSGTIKIQNDAGYRQLFESLVENANATDEDGNLIYAGNWEGFVNPEIRKELGMKLKAGVGQEDIVQGVEGFVRDFTQRVGNQFIEAGKQIIKDKEGPTDNRTPWYNSEEQRTLARIHGGLDFFDEMHDKTVKKLLKEGKRTDRTNVDGSSNEEYANLFKQNVINNLNTLTRSGEWDTSVKFTTMEDAEKDAFVNLTNSQLVLALKNKGVAINEETDTDLIQSIKTGNVAMWRIDSESSGEGSILDSLFTFTRADTGKELTTYQINRLPYTDLQGKIIVVKKPLAISLLPNLTREELDKFTFKVGVKNGGKVIGQEFNELKAAVKSKFIPDIKNGLFKNYFSKGAVGGGQVDFVLKHLGDEGLITYHAIDMFGDDPELTVDDQMSQRLQETTNIDPGILFSRGIKPTFRQPFSELYRKAGVNN